MALPDPTRCFRLNRPLVTQLPAVRRLHAHFGGTLLVDLHPTPAEKILVSRAKASALKAWLKGWLLPYLGALIPIAMTALTLKSPVLERLTDEEFYQFCMDNRDWRIERKTHHQISFMPPVSSESASTNGELFRQLANWNVEQNLGKTFDSSAGFYLKTGAMLSPDASWIAWEHWNTLGPDDRRGFARICPDFVVELLSPTDRLTDTMQKMEHWLAAGTRLGWLIAPNTESVYIFEPGQPVRPIVGFDQELVAGPVLPDFALELRRLKEG